ncbi:MAG: hypothetical protein WC805_00615 [Patescibacteria group bacterium]|jgi:hypothetical protein
MGKKRKSGLILSSKKLWLQLIGVVVIAGVIYYGVSFANKSSAFGIIEPGNGPSSLGTQIVYISNSGDNNNTGLTQQTPVRDIRKAVAVANQFSSKLVTVKFMESQYQATPNDLYNYPGDSKISIYNPMAIAFKPNDTIESVSIKAPYSSNALITVAVYADSPTPVVTQSVFLDRIGGNNIGLQIVGAKAQVIVKKGRFTGATSPSNHYQLQVTTSKYAEIIGNYFELSKPIIGSYNANRVMPSLKLGALDNKPTSIRVTENTFILPADYSETYTPGSGITQSAGILVMTGPAQIFGNIFKTTGIDNFVDKIGGGLLDSGNLHNIGIITCYESRNVEITNNDFSTFDGLDVVSRAHIEQAYHNENKQSVIIKDNFLWKQ